MYNTRDIIKFLIVTDCLEQKKLITDCLEQKKIDEELITE